MLPCSVMGMALILLSAWQYLGSWRIWTPWTGFYGSSWPERNTPPIVVFCSGLDSRSRCTRFHGFWQSWDFLVFPGTGHKLQELSLESFNGNKSKNAWEFLENSWPWTRLVWTKPGRSDHCCCWLITQTHTHPISLQVTQIPNCCG